VGGVLLGIVGGILAACAAGAVFGIAGSVMTYRDLEMTSNKVRYTAASTVATGLAIGIVGGFTLAIAGGVGGGLAYGIAVGTTAGVVGGIAIGKPINITSAIIIAVAGGGLIFLLLVANSTSEVAFGVGTAFALAFTITAPRAYYIPVHAYFLWLAPIIDSLTVQDRVNHDRLMAAVAERVSDRRVLLQIGRYLTTGVLDVGSSEEDIATSLDEKAAHDAALTEGIETLERLQVREALLRAVTSTVGRRYKFHPVFWDDLCGVPFPWLDRLLVRYAEHDIRSRIHQIDELIEARPPQRAAAARAKTILVAKEMGREMNLSHLDTLSNQLPEGSQGFLTEVPLLREMITQIAQRQRQLNTVQRPVFREPLANALRTEIDNFRHRVERLREPLASSFQAAATHWLAIADRELHEAQVVVNKKAIPQVFRAGDPVDRDREAFVPRHGVIGELEGQLMLATGCPGLLLYGRRRTGKSTTLKNLIGFLPRHVGIVNISMQDPEAFTSLASFIRLLSGWLTTLAPAETPRELEPNLAQFISTLSNTNARLGEGNRRLLLAIDEYENLDEKFEASVFPIDLLAVFRESMQNHRQITWMFSGSHDIAELHYAPWASYLVSARTIEMPLFSEDETKVLLTEPLSHSSFWQRNEAKRPHFPAEVWGEGGIERIHAEAGGWPHLVQLIAETTIDILNDSNEQAANFSLLNKAFDRAVVRGDLVLRQLVQNECRSPGEWDYVRGFRRFDEQPVPQEDLVYQSLRRRLLVTEGENLFWRLRVPIMQRWLRQRG
jgi:hypothetical protein